jgi:hypothetical protein
MKKITLKEAVDWFGEKNPTQFMSIRGYQNQNGEVADHLVQLNIDRSKLAEKALAMLDAITPENDLQKEAIEALRQSILNPSESRSNGQTGAFIRLNSNVQFCPETRQISIFGGQRISKKVLVPGVYKTVNSKPLTIEKKKVSKEIPYFNPARYNLDPEKYKFFVDDKNVLVLVAK